jgi:uncharacterized membrane protein YcaP (DUF421 family)
VTLHDIVTMSEPVAEKIIRAAAIYCFLIFALRLAGKRELAQLSTADFVVLLAVANAVQNAIIGNDDSVTGGVLSATTLFVLNATVAFLLYRSARVRRLLEGRPTILVEDGKLVEANLRRQGIRKEELLVVIQVQGADLAQVKRCVLEPNGSIVVTRVQDSRELQALAALSAEVRALTEWLHSADR